MTTKSNLHPLIIIIIIAIILFIAALLWKQTRIDNSEVPTIPTPPKIKISNKNKLNKSTDDNRSQPEIKKPTYNSNRIMTVEEKQSFKDDLKHVQNTALMLNTPEKLMKQITYLQGIGDEKKANDMIELLLKTFPDYEVPN